MILVAGYLGRQVQSTTAVDPWMYWQENAKVYTIVNISFFIMNIKMSKYHGKCFIS